MSAEAALDRWQRLDRARLVLEFTNVTLLVAATAAALLAEGNHAVEAAAWVLGVVALGIGALVMFWVRPRLAEALDEVGADE